LLLQQDARGNLPLHTAVLGGRDDCLRKLLFGLSLTDAHALLNRVPNRQNLTILDLISVKHAHVKLTAEIKAQRITVADAQAILQNIKDGNKRIQEFLMEAIRKAEDVIARNGGKTMRPSFDLARIPTIQLAMRNTPQGAPTAQRQPEATGASSGG
jgi:ankyrin repeat protein